MWTSPAVTSARGRRRRQHDRGLDHAIAALVEVDHALERAARRRDLLEVLEQRRIDLGQRRVAQLDAACVAGDAEELEERRVRDAHACRCDRTTPSAAATAPNTSAAALTR